jgi:hypothetical protein
MARQGEYGPTIVNSGRYLRLTRVIVEAESPHRADRQDRRFAVGLERILDGLAVHL